MNFVELPGQKNGENNEQRALTLESPKTHQNDAGRGLTLSGLNLNATNSFERLAATFVKILHFLAARLKRS